MDKKNLQKTIKSYALCTVGTIIFCLGTIYFIVPANLYSGGILGLAQLIRSLLVIVFPTLSAVGIDIAGIISFSINLPLLLLALNKMSRAFTIKTLFSIGLQTVIFSIIPPPSVAIVDDVLTGSIIGGVITGIGIGFVLSSGATAGGIDIIGIILTLKMRNFSVGTFAIWFNTSIYIASAVMFDLSVAIYSTISVFIFSFVADRWHKQNVRVMAITFTNCHDLPNDIIKYMNRGVTQWQGKGSYTMDDKLIFITVISQGEVTKLREIIKKRDENAFIILNKGFDVVGNYEKRLTEH